MEILDQNSLVLETKKNVLVCISLFISICEIYKKENLIINISFLLFLTSKKLVIQRIINSKKSLIIPNNKEEGFYDNIFRYCGTVPPYWRKRSI
jgi:hypothetical protein